ncbi:hypothetical protein D3C85_1560340 [compost metagenome]
MQHGDPAVGVQRQEIGVAVLALLDAHMVQGVGHPQFLEGDGDLEAVGRTVRIEVQGGGGHGRGKKSRAISWNTGLGPFWISCVTS